MNRNNIIFSGRINLFFVIVVGYAQNNKFLWITGDENYKIVHKKRFIIDNEL